MASRSDGGGITKRRSGDLHRNSNETSKWKHAFYVKEALITYAESVISFSRPRVWSFQPQCRCSNTSKINGAVSFEVMANVSLSTDIASQRFSKIIWISGVHWSTGQLSRLRRFSACEKTVKIHTQTNLKQACLILPSAIGCRKYS